jgi:hypothetical protein
MIVRNDDGKVAVKWVINPNGKTVQMQGTKIFYVFKAQNHVVLDWIDPSHVSALLTIQEKTCNCGGGKKKQAFELANLLDVNIWMTNNRYGEENPNYREVE